MHRAKFSHDLVGTGSAVGIKFQPGAFRGYFGKPVILSTDRILPIEQVFDTPTRVLEQVLMDLEEPATMQGELETLLRRRPRRHDERAAEVAAIVKLIEDKKDLYSVSRLADLAQELGYFDQAHFGRTFQALTGYSPSGYRRR